jgi:hypothetical protein
MKLSLILSTGLVLGSALLAMGQSAPPQNSQVMGRGRGGAPFAWNDKNKDGICDLTGLPVGSGRGNRAMRGGRRAWGGSGMGRGFGARFQNAQPAAAPAPAQK